MILIWYYHTITHCHFLDINGKTGYYRLLAHQAIATLKAVKKTVSQIHRVELCRKVRIMGTLQEMEDPRMEKYKLRVNARPRTRFANKKVFPQNIIRKYLLKEEQCGPPLPGREWSTPPASQSKYFPPRSCEKHCKNQGRPKRKCHDGKLHLDSQAELPPRKLLEEVRPS